MGMSSGGGRGGPLAEINVTPLVDVMLVLLIIFMVAAPMLTTGVSVDLPNAEAPAMDVDEKMPIIAIAAVPPTDPDDPMRFEIFFFDELVPLDGLEAKLRTDERVMARKEVYVNADERVPYGQVARVLAIVRQAGVEKLGLVTEPLEE